MKNHYYLLLAGLFLTSAFALQAQDSRLFMPSEFRDAYDNGTRSYDGRPGKSYWQNTADYTMEITVDPETRLLEGTEEVVYHNNSPDELSSLVVRIYQDAFRKGNSRAYGVAPDDINDGTSITRLVINGETYDMGNRREVSRQATHLDINLKSPLKAGEKVTMNVDWSLTIPNTNIRMGVFDSTTFFVGYFYPQVAVYDDVFGWDRLSYTFRTEFYNNLGNFDVTIHAPESFTIWSTGVLQNAKEVYPANIYQRYEQAQASMETVHILTADELFTESGYQNLSGSWHYVAKDVSDFAFGISDHFGWDAAMQKVDGRQVLVSTAFPADKAERFVNVTAIAQKAMQHMSEDVPGIPYPYPRFTTFIGSDGGGMEFPMMANNAGPGRGVTIHELFHTYFPMYVRTNEKRFAWMDEGWADYITDWLTDRYFEKTDDPLYNNFSSGIRGNQGTYSDLPLIVSSQYTDDSNYGYSAYNLPAFIYGMLHQHLGDELFLKCYREYIRRWAQKSPTPYDFFFTFENVSGQDLAWLWKPWFFEFGSPDVAIESYSKGKLVIRNKGERPAPLTVKIVYNDGKENELVQSAAVWKSADTYSTTIADYKNVRELIVNEKIVDVNELDNYYPSLQEQYKQLTISEDILGAYAVNEFPVEVTIEQKEGILYMRISRINQTGYLIPESATQFRSLDGEAKLQFIQEDGTTVGLQMQSGGFRVTAKKL
ncbi:MAG: M1 family metallopeptidase [Saprospirales bacterium]|nr:M1 family metallopeptidase [Saprospirales bacterium]